MTSPHFGSFTQFQATSLRNEVPQEKLGEWRQCLARVWKGWSTTGKKVVCGLSFWKGSRRVWQEPQETRVSGKIEELLYELLHCCSTESIFSSKQVSCFFVFWISFMRHIIKLWAFWLLRDSRKPKIFISLKLTLQPCRRKIYCELPRGKLAPLCQVDLSLLL